MKRSIVITAFLGALILPSARAETGAENTGPVRKTVFLPGRYVQALFAVAEERGKDRSLSKTERDLANFEITVAEYDSDVLEIDYLPHKAADAGTADEKRWDRSGGTSLGRAMVYGVRKKDLHIEWVKLFK